MEFCWNDWNVEHVTVHGASPEEAESVVREAREPFPLRHEEGKWLVWGRGRGGRLLQVIFVIDEDDAIYVIHARPLTGREKQRYRKRMNR